MSDSQSQKAGARSQQIQVMGDLVVGVTEDRAREIMEITAKSVIGEYSLEAIAVGEGRIAALEDRVVRLLSDAGLLPAFGDPSFQVSLKKAQIGAASSERETDYDMLAELLADRAQRGQSRPVRASLDRAIQIVDQLDEAALVGLTAFTTLTTLRPTSGLVSEGLQTMEILIRDVSQSGLPDGPDWLDHLDVLGAVRVSTIANLREFDDFFAADLHGYVATGAEPGTDAVVEASRRLAEIGLLLPVVEHELRPGYVRLAFRNLSTLEEALKQHGVEQENHDEIVEIAKSVYGIETVSPDAQSEFVARIESMTYLSTTRDWWNKLGRSVEVTGVGRVLARANAIRLDTGGGLADGWPS